jgi:hypothetical protein
MLRLPNNIGVDLPIPLKPTACHGALVAQLGGVNENTSGDERLAIWSAALFMWSPRQQHGAALLRCAVLRVIGAAETIGVRALLVHAISDEEAKAFYAHQSFRAAATDPITLMITMRRRRKCWRR